MLIDLGTLTAIHTGLSLVALILGIPAILALFNSSLSPHWNAIFLVTAFSTIATGFFFPFEAITPAFATGILSSAVLAAMAYAYYGRRLAGKWRWIYTAGVVASLYFMVFVTIAQIFNKTLALHTVSPILFQGLFAGVELLALAVFIIIGIRAVKYNPILIDRRQ